ncbi:glycerol-3-phosphate cytidylyltransferase [Virgibacillus natechei]|uniref:Glycerol-3-phosphate cytidylyltransferase n=1 Tax=Virgibacillus natechei TaxID=1216297 RepID=A0ABS4IEL3_9BACI|nr:glycerol-3-phosphate cytidylyltransferase [Virgibacillus natechei]MBP1969378.1 glycerol-3-phosphate cytidylyltransferase [Virgibacillus natechei]UZD12522.1 glycerol-3-phosphate cytidylyltransferase [Virgibacillus natechei]
MKKIITYGTFDFIHRGHINILRRAQDLGDHLIVGLSTDKFNMTKGKQAYHNYEDRKLIIDAISYVDQVIPEYTWDQKITDVITHDIDTFVMGDDWKGEFDFLKAYCEVVYLPRTKGISSSAIRNSRLHSRND